MASGEYRHADPCRRAYRALLTMDPVVHFQMPAGDLRRISAFYSQAFGWRTQELGAEMGNYVVVSTTATGPDGRPSEPGAINGGFYQRPDDPAGQCTHVVIAVQDIEAAIAAVSDAGGTVSGPAEEIPGVGLFATFQDTEGNRVSMLQPNPPVSGGAA